MLPFLHFSAFNREIFKLMRRYSREDLSVPEKAGVRTKSSFLARSPIPRRKNLNLDFTTTRSILEEHERCNGRLHPSMRRPAEKVPNLTRRIAITGSVLRKVAIVPRESPADSNRIGDVM